MTEIVLPADTNNYGTIFGGRLLALADKCAAMSAVRHCRRPVVTASFDRVDFLRPVRRGYFVVLTGEVTATFRTSMEIQVTVEAEHPERGERQTTCLARVTMVAIDEAGRPVAVPPLEFDSEDERARAERAAERRRQRLARRDLEAF
ncbi:MAG: acyl-CoA thioesterase [Acidobacteria bacterium]|nr:MAG: acyl-CoA thioesterase [Acidobacteriota bacterium]